MYGSDGKARRIRSGEGDAQRSGDNEGARFQYSAKSSRAIDEGEMVRLFPLRQWKQKRPKELGEAVCQLPHGRGRRAQAKWTLRTHLPCTSRSEVRISTGKTAWDV